MTGGLYFHSYALHYWLIACNTSLLIGSTEEAKKCVSRPCSSIRYLQKFQEGACSFHPFFSLCESHLKISF